jgi:SAM-dependent methyltransferase
LKTCPLCGSTTETLFDDPEKRLFLICPACTLVFVPEEYHISAEAERQRYALHDNVIINSGYVRFLTEVITAVSPYLNENSMVLDYGCGENAVLMQVLRNEGVACDAYDPLYSYPYPVEKQYDVIILCEVIEHCRNLQELFQSLRMLLRPEGIVCIRTQCYRETAGISRWWYAQDVTHINFFLLHALETVARKLDRKVVGTEKGDIFLFITGN